MAEEIQKKIWAQRAELRNALCAQYECFLHETTKKRLDSIRKTGLEARPPGTSSDDDLMRALGHNGTIMVCLHPLGSSGGLESTCSTGPYVLLSVKNSAVPDEVTLDWSCTGCWGLAPIIERDEPWKTPKQIFLDVVRRRGTVSGLSGIETKHLFILCKGESASASVRWRPLVETTDDDVMDYPAAGQPPPVPGCPS
jgi:hypothetical protein